MGVGGCVKTTHGGGLAIGLGKDIRALCRVIRGQRGDRSSEIPAH